MQETAITSDLISAHGLSPSEYDRILDIIGREPPLTETDTFYAMWNEHCTYNYSKKLQSTLTQTGPHAHPMTTL